MVIVELLIWQKIKCNVCSLSQPVRYRHTSGVHRAEDMHGLIAIVHIILSRNWLEAAQCRFGTNKRNTIANYGKGVG